MKDNIKPVMGFQNMKPTMTVSRSDATAYGTGVTYNESGITYNETGYLYGGVAGYDVQPMFAYLNNPKANIRFVSDVSGSARGSIVLHAGMPIGPGFFLYLTYPTSSTITL